MADLTKVTEFLHIGFETVDEKVNYIKIPYPRSDITANEVKLTANNIIDNKVWLDKNGDSYTSTATAYIETKTIKQLDID